MLKRPAPYSRFYYKYTSISQSGNTALFGCTHNTTDDYQNLSHPSRRVLGRQFVRSMPEPQPHPFRIGLIFFATFFYQEKKVEEECMSITKRTGLLQICERLASSCKDAQFISGITLLKGCKKHQFQVCIRSCTLNLAACSCQLTNSS